MNEQRAVRDNLSLCAGMLLGPAAWAANTQLGQILPYVDCRGGLRLSAIACFVAALLSLAGSFTSARVRKTDATRDSREKRTPRSFLGLLSSLLGLVFAFTLALQGLSALILSPCER
jgi:hypothetical protein